jgi:hypothetical protein
MDMKSNAITRLIGATTLTTAIALTSGIGIPSTYAKTKQDIGKMDTTVDLENSGAGALGFLGGQAELNLGSAIAQDGTTQKIKEFKAQVRMKNSGAGALGFLGGRSQTNIGSAVSKK